MGVEVAQNVADLAEHVVGGVEDLVHLADGRVDSVELLPDLLGDLWGFVGGGGGGGVFG